MDDEKIYYNLENKDIFIIFLLVLSIGFGLSISKQLYSEENSLWIISVFVTTMFLHHLIEYIKFLIPDLDQRFVLDYIKGILIIVCLGVIIMSIYTFIHFELSVIPKSLHSVFIEDCKELKSYYKEHYSLSITFEESNDKCILKRPDLLYIEKIQNVSGLNRTKIETFTEMLIISEYSSFVDRKNILSRICDSGFGCLKNYELWIESR